MYTSRSYHWDRDVMGDLATGSNVSSGGNDSSNSSSNSSSNNGRDKGKREKAGSSSGSSGGKSYASVAGSGAAAPTGRGSNPAADHRGKGKGSDGSSPIVSDSTGGGVRVRVRLLIRRCASTYCFGDVVEVLSCLNPGDGRSLMVRNSVYVHCSSIDPAAVDVRSAASGAAVSADGNGSNGGLNPNDKDNLSALGVYKLHIRKGALVEVTAGVNVKGWIANSVHCITITEA